MLNPVYTDHQQEEGCDHLKQELLMWVDRLMFTSKQAIVPITSLKLLQQTSEKSHRSKSV